MTTNTPTLVPAELTELLEDAALTLEQLAHCVRQAPEWVLTHVEAGVLHPTHGNAAAEWRFASATLLRARRIADLEHSFDADPQLAALAVDLMEEVAALRRQLGQF
ncbi:chaperone modulator CbpM [Methylobacillus sp. Pita1]|uniref:chaperone modulator CbpM n=1 Tax=Methylobacillus sp. Pita1 TaxID=3382642 RepID=UPI0038B61413